MMTLKAEQAERGLSSDDKLRRLASVNERLNTRTWTDSQIRGIPEDLVLFAYEHSEALQREFGDITTFTAYRRACGAGRARIAGRK